MNALLTAWACAVLFGAAAQDQALSARAIVRLQQTPVSQLDAELPERSFAVWFKQLVGARAGVSWQLTDCGEPSAQGDAADDDLPACVEVSAVLPNERKAVVTVTVGTFKKGWTGAPKFYFAVIEDQGELHPVPRLRDLPELLRASLPRVRRQRPPTSVKPPTLLPATSRVLPSRAPGNVPMPIVVAEPPPPPPRVETRISRGIALGAAVTKVTPVYPDAARLNNIAGEVQVEVTISPQGRVLEARASSGHPLLRVAAEQAARKWVFNPATLNGAPVKTQGTLTFVFTRP